MKETPKKRHEENIAGTQDRNKQESQLTEVRLYKSHLQPSLQSTFEK